MWESLGMLVLTIINPRCGVFRQLSTSSFFFFFLIELKFFLPSAAGKGYKQHLLLLYKWQDGQLKEKCLPAMKLYDLFKADPLGSGLYILPLIVLLCLNSLWIRTGWRRGQQHGIKKGPASPSTYHAPANEQWSLWLPGEQETDQGSSPGDCGKRQKVTNDWSSLPCTQTKTWSCLKVY